MADDTKYMSLVVAYYDEEDAATETLLILKQIDKVGAIRVREAAVLKFDADGKLRIAQQADQRGIRRIGASAVAGGVIGVLFPPSILAMTAVGSVAAVAWNHFRDHGFDKNLLKEIGENLPPGGAAVAAVVEDEWLGHVEAAVEGYTQLQRYVFDTDSLVGLGLYGMDAPHPPVSVEPSEEFDRRKS